MVAGVPSGLPFLAAGPRLAAPDGAVVLTLRRTPTPTSRLKTRVRGSRRCASSRLCWRGRSGSMFTPGSRGCAYKTVLGRGKWIAGSAFATAYYHSDGNGNVTCLMYPNGTLAAKYLYDPFGNMLSQSGSLASANRYRFSSKEWDSNSGLYYYLYRFYDPNLQRWVNRDPLLEAGFTIFSTRHNMLTALNSLTSLSDADNLFEFCANDPIVSIDPKGTQFSAILRIFVPRMFPKYSLGGPYIPSHCMLTSSKKSCAPVGPSATLCTYSCTEGGYSDEASATATFSVTKTKTLGQNCLNSINPPFTAFDN